MIRKHAKEWLIWTFVLVLFILAPILTGWLVKLHGGNKVDIPAWIGFFGNYSGGIIGGFVTLIGIRMTIRHERELVNEEKIQKNELAKSIIEVFLLQEMKYNFYYFYSKEGFRQALSTSKESFAYAYDPEKIKTQEFDRVKYELLNFRNSRFVIDTLEVYMVFSMLKNMKDISRLSQTEYKRLQDVFAYLDSFLKSW